MKGKWPGHGGPKGATPISQVAYPSLPRTAAVMLSLWPASCGSANGGWHPLASQVLATWHTMLHARGSRSGAAQTLIEARACNEYWICSLSQSMAVYQWLRSSQQMMRAAG